LGARLESGCFGSGESGNSRIGMRGFLRYWHDPGYWRWHWQRASVGTKSSLLVLLALLVGVGGYFTAVLAGSAATTAPYVPPTQKLVTVERTVVQRMHGQTRVVTQLQKIVVPSASERVVTLSGSGRTVVQEVTVQRPGRDRVVTVLRPGRDRVVTQAQTRTVLQQQTIERPVTVTTAVNGPTVTERTTAPSRTVTATGPTQTVSNTVTQPPRTVTEAITNTVTATLTTTATVTVTTPCKRPPCP
jgi:hypothetical protein